VSGVGSILLIQDRRMGDVVLTAALLEDLAVAYPAAAVDFLVGAPAAPLLQHHPLIRDIVVLDKDRVVGMWRDVRGRSYDMVIDVQGNLRTAMLARASAAPVRVGWRVRGKAWAYTHPVERQRNRRYVVHDRQRLLHAVGVQTSALLPRLYLTDQERAEGLDVVRGLGVDTAGVVLGMMLTSRDPARDWPVRHFVTLSRLLHGAGITTVLFPGGGDAENIAQFQARGGRAVVGPLVGIRPLMGLIRACTLFVSPDTGPAHIATALGVPRVTLYGPSSPLGWSPGLDTTVALQVSAADGTQAGDAEAGGAQSARGRAAGTASAPRSDAGGTGGSMVALEPEVVLRAVLDLVARIAGR
jgi:ADP-heptose:LPS heptosyltransferase